MNHEFDFPLVDNDRFHDACGIGFVATRSGKPESRILPLALKALKRLSHRGAKSYDNNSGDGAGLMIDIPSAFFKKVVRDEKDISLSRNEDLAIAVVFHPSKSHNLFDKLISELSHEDGIDFLLKREVPLNEKALGELSKKKKPYIYQYIFRAKKQKNRALEKKLYIIRKKIEKKFLSRKSKPYFCSFSSKTIVYKGLMSSYQLDKFYPDLNQKLKVKVALFHERFSTNTFSSWEMAQPFRMIAHNGEFNTIKGSRLWMNAREANLKSEVWGKDIANLKPIISKGGSDSESFDQVAEFLLNSGRTLFDLMMIMIPDSYNQIKKYYKNDTMSKKMRDYFIYHENFMKPWDGPAAIVYTDGDYVGAKMDRNGLRPLRYSLTKCGLIIMASEAGVVNIEDNNLIANYHMKSEEIFGMNLKTGEILKNKEIKLKEASKKPYGKLVKNNVHSLNRSDGKKEFECLMETKFYDPNFDPVDHGLNKEDISKFLMPMSNNVSEPVGSMGDDTPLAILSKQNRKFYDYFKQQFAQVTNPPIDSLREKSVMSLLKYLGSEDNLLNQQPTNNIAIKIPSPILSPSDINYLVNQTDWFPNSTISCSIGGNDKLKTRIDKIKKAAEKKILNGTKIIFLSDVALEGGRTFIPMPLVVSAVHHHLIIKRLRSKASIVCITGDCIEDHHFAVLIALGASGIYPIGSYLTIQKYNPELDFYISLGNYRHSIEKGLLKVMSKMGISTLTSYHGSMLLHAIGLGRKLSKEYFPSIPSLIGGIELEDIEKTLKKRIRLQTGNDNSGGLKEIGLFRYRKSGEAHGYSPTVFKKIQYLGTNGKKPYTKINDDRPIYIRDLLRYKTSTPILNLEAIENSSSILKRFGSGGISFGAISEKSHRELAKGFSLVGARSNTGEGGEKNDRYSISNDDTTVNSYVKQIASGRFGVNSEYLAAAHEIQIKIAQGAKPGEGGQLPGFKVSSMIAATRSSSPGIPLISPPPHHDIYSIEDIKQLIYDLKDVNPRAKVSVKLVSQPGVGIVASGVVKAGANIILISGADGGTGASPLGSQKHTGFPWEYGLAETHQTLYSNGLREYVTLRVDGGIKEAKDIIFAAILGAEEFDFGTSALIALGCVMARQCHLNTCPVGIATTDEKVEKRFKGKAENVSRYLESISESVRNELSKIGKTNLHDIIGRTDLLRINEKHEHLIKSKKIDLKGIINKESKKGLPLISHMKLRYSNLRREKTVDEKIMKEIRQEIITQGQAAVTRNIQNTDRAIGARISGELSYLFGHNNYRGNIQCKLTGVAGQSFGAFLSKGIELRLKGLANDYVAKSMSSGTISIRMSKAVRRRKKHNTLIGNVALYGATGGELYIAGSAAERFAVRNSGAIAVVEGIGNHGCEYMSQGTVIILGRIGKNFGAGMTGGVVYIHTKYRNLDNYLNHDFVEIVKLQTKDENIIRRLIKNHVFHTGSNIASTIERDWSKEIKNFIKISPKNYENMNFDSLYEQQKSFRA